MAELEDIARAAVDIGLGIHRELGPGLLESVYEALLHAHLTSRGFAVERQKPMPIEVAGLRLKEGFRADLLVEGKLILEVKSVEQLMPVHGRQLLTYLRLARLPLGLLMNFGGATFRGNVRRIVNDHRQVPPIEPALRHG
ncbi:MAG: GxxExxY protein [Allosphingosinicella sp.]|uniref:GxxExxY protein n=1 Tax=Allosphingosinicella sp. TaxID=2823234 RepID=UPI00395D569A